MIQLSFRHILCTGYIQTSEKGNVQCPETKSLINPPNQFVKTIENLPNENHTVVQHDIDPEDELLERDTKILEEYEDIHIEDSENINSLNIYDQNAIVFFAGYVARRSVAKTNCDNCRNIIMKPPMDDATENEKYIAFREYPNIDEDAPTVTKLIRPTTLFAKVVETQLVAFNRSWKYYWSSTQILNKITNECIDLTNKIHPEWLDKNDACYNHRLQALKYMINVKLYSRTRYNNRANKIVTASRRKVKNFSNK
ncbi:uncharacterized protein [Anoplolepis gracilipes]|uniref:uncharacterized protein n=1 Tax=Anoplolepis gracilipes TaxID=354296 RepID=UPI003B9FAB23